MWKPEPKFAKLVRKADDAGKIRKYAVNPDVVALRVERVMLWITVLMWSGVTFGLLFTIPNVHAFISDGAAKGTTDWFIGWAVSPAVQLPLVGLLIAASYMARYHVAPSWQVQYGKFLLLGAELGMNTWRSIEAQDADEIFKHAIPVLIVMFCAEGVTDLRSKLTECVEKAYSLASETKSEIVEAFPVSAPPAIVIPEPVEEVEIPEEIFVEPTPEPEPVVIPEPEKKIEIPEPPKEEDSTKYRPATGKRAQKDAEDITKMREIWPGLDFLMIDEKARHGLIMKQMQCGGSRASRLRDMYVALVEKEVREEVR